MFDVLAYLEIASIIIFRYILIAGIAFLFFYILLFKKNIKNKIQERKANKKDFFREFGHSVMSSAVFALTSFTILFTPLAEYTLVYKDIGAYPIWYFFLSIFLALVIHDTYFYWMHRTLHHKKLYKTMHLVHHKSVNPSPWAAYSFHFTEAITESMIAPIIFFILPIHPIAFMIFTLISLMINVYGHLGFEIMPKWFRHTPLFEVINTSVHHNLHHSKFNGNYGLYFRFWDRIMKTEMPNYVEEYDRIQEQRFGNAQEKLKPSRLEHI